MSWRIVPMTASHIPAIAAIEQACFADPWTEVGLMEELVNPCARFLVAESEDGVLGYLGCHHIAGEGFIANVAVSPAYRRQGVARSLLKEAIGQGASLSRLTLEVRLSNAAAIALYTSLGFVKDGVRPRFYSHPAEDAGIYSYYPKK